MRRFAILLLTVTFLVSCSSVDNRLTFGGKDKKIWVTDLSWMSDSGTEYRCPFSFFISDVDENSISGKIQLGALALPNLYIYRWDNAPGLMDFSGTIDGQVAICEFNVYQGHDKANLQIYKNEEGQLVAQVDFRNSDDDFYGISGRNFCFRPYNIAKDLGSREKEKDISISANLETWGSVNLVAGFSGNSPWAVLVDDSENIVYTFYDFIWGVRIVDIAIEDVNGDGLEDLTFYLDGIYDNLPEDEQLYTRYLQMATGEFYSESLQPRQGRRQGDGSSVLTKPRRQGDGSSVLTKPWKGDDISSNSEIGK